MQIYLIFFLGGHYFLDIQYVRRFRTKLRLNYMSPKVLTNIISNTLYKIRSNIRLMEIEYDKSKQVIYVAL